MFNELKKINERPRPFEFYTVEELWTDEHTSKRMLECHLDEELDLSSRNRKFIERSSAWINSNLQLKQNSKIIDFGCGPGLYTTLLAEAGLSVTGIDFSSNSISYAKRVAEEKKLKINYINENYLNFQTNEKFDLVMMIMCDYCVLSPAQRKDLLAKFKSIINDDGIILLDVYSNNSFDKISESSSYEFNQLGKFWAPDDYYSFLNIYKYGQENVSLEKYTVVEKSRTRVVYNWLQYFTQETLKNEFNENGLKIENFYLNVAGDPFIESSDEFAVVAKKQ